MHIHIIECYIGDQTQENFYPGTILGNRDDYGNADIYIHNVLSITRSDELVVITYTYDTDCGKYCTSFKKDDFHRIEVY